MSEITELLPDKSDLGPSILFLCSCLSWVLFYTRPHEDSAEGKETFLASKVSLVLGQVSVPGWAGHGRSARPLVSHGDIGGNAKPPGCKAPHTQCSNAIVVARIFYQRIVTVKKIAS